MKINELAKLSHVGVETIRMYRNRGLLNPRQNENGYYEYSALDLQNLLYIRKLRGSNLSLDTIAATYRRSDLEELIRGYEEEYEALERQIEELHRRRDILKLTMEHFEDYRETFRGVAEVDVPDDRYDLILRSAPSPVLDSWLADMMMFTQGVYIPEAYLKEPLADRIPVQLTIGSYLPLLRENGFTIPPEALCFPRGRYLTARIVLDNDATIPAAQLQPVLDYASDHGLTLTGGTTAFLARVDTSGGRPRFVYRLRVRLAEQQKLA